MSVNNLPSVLKSCSEGDNINEVTETNLVPKPVEGSRLKRTFTLPRNPFGTIRPNTSKNKSNTIENRPVSGNIVTNETSREDGTFERKLFRRPSWKRFLNKIAHHMSTVNVPGVKSPTTLSGERVPCSGEPPWPPGSTPAATGIKNHGNTCYMNAVLQCLSHTDVIAEYFVLDHYKVDLQKRNKINSKKYGTRGEVTEQLATLLKALWSCNYSPDLSTAFKGAVERHGTQYRGNNQHDAQEFLFWLLDKVHEDLNTATKKKYKIIKNTCGKPDEVVAAETLANHARRNSSFVQTVFQAQYRSALTCSKCERTSCTFDPFHCVSVQLPPRQATAQPSPLPVNVVYVNQQPRQVKIGVELTPTATMDDLRDTLHTDTGIEKEHIILAEINEMGWCNARAGWEVAGVDFGSLYCVEAPPLLQTPTTPYLLLLWVNLLEGERFGSVYAMQVPREVCYSDLQKLMLKEMSQVVAERVLEEAQTCHIFTARIAEAHRPRDPAYLDPELPHPLFSLDVEQAMCAHEKYPNLRLELLWDAKHRDSIVRDTMESCEVHVSCAPPPDGPLTLHQCLTHYTRAETLAQEDAWRCPQCQRYMPVIKTLGLWSLPDILVIHLKRFRQQAKGRSSTKLTTMVEFPLTELDMGPHIATSPGATDEHLYDLYAVCYHLGDDLETGHYTAACRNPYDHTWYKFDDAHVTPVTDHTHLINNTAYMLFYKRKQSRISHVGSDHTGHWALRMTPQRRIPVTVLPEEEETTEVIEQIPKEEAPVSTPTAQCPLVVEINETTPTKEPTNEITEPSSSTSPYIHKDVHINPKMTPIESRRPRSVDSPPKPSVSSRSCDSSPLVASINQVEYRPTTEDLVLTMFQENNYIVPRHAGPHIANDAHITGEKSSVWKTRIST